MFNPAKKAENPSSYAICNVKAQQPSDPEQADFHENFSAKLDRLMGLRSIRRTMPCRASFHSILRIFKPLCLLLAVSSMASASPWSFGPLYDEFSLTLASGQRKEAVGPFFSYEEKNSQQQWVFSPLLSYTLDRELEVAEFDLLYPVITHNQFGQEYRFQIFQLFSFAGGQEQEGYVNRRFTLFPIYFYQGSPNPEERYHALLPFYGRIKNRLLRDEIHFILFPLYSQTRRKDVVTDNYLYPLFHIRRGEQLAGWQFWPFYGQENRVGHTRTNHWGEDVFVPGHDRMFVLWPFFFNERNEIGTENPTRRNALLPLYTLERSPLRDSTTAPWPIGVTYTHDRERGYRELGVPWPVILFARGEGKNTTRVWPLFSRAQTPEQRSDFYLWPVYNYRRIDSYPLERERRRVLFFLFNDIKETTLETGDSRRRTDLWPLFTRRRELDGNQRLQILAPLEPILPNNKSVERNYSPIWSVWRSEHNPEAGASSQSLLWNLYRRDVTPERRKVSFLLGLFQYEAGALGKRWRVFYLPFGAPRAEPAEND